jgi:hypothetical protein
MVLIRNFKSTTIWKAFVLNAMTSSLTIFIAITVKTYLDKYNINDDNSNNVSPIYINIVTLLVTFSTALFSYYIMFQIFGFGGGMLSQSK